MESTSPTEGTTPIPSAVDRYRISVNTAGHLFCMFAMREARGDRWSLDTMPESIRQWVEIYADNNLVSREYWPEMVTIALEFYRGHLEKALVELVGLQDGILLED